MGLTLVIALAAALTVPTPAAAAPRFSLSTTGAIPGDHITLRLTSTPKPARKPLRIYLLASEFARETLARSDPRLHQIATLVPQRRRIARFTVPSLAAGTYALAYCGCTGTPYARVAGAPVLVVQTPPEPTACSTTAPNNTAPAGAPPLSFLGNSQLAILIPPDGVLRATEPDGTLFNKMLWIAARGRTKLRVSYRRVDVAAPAIGAVTVGGTLSGYDGPSWASRMYFDRGCWEIRGSAGTASLTAVLRVVTR